MKFEEFQRNVWGWSSERGIFEHSTATAQLLKAVSEMGELADAEAKNDLDAIIDAAGDILVCLVNYLAMRNIAVGQCLDKAWDEIKDRQGRMIEGGVFVKDE